MLFRLGLNWTSQFLPKKNILCEKLYMIFLFICHFTKLTLSTYPIQSVWSTRFETCRSQRPIRWWKTSRGLPQASKRNWWLASSCRLQRWSYSPTGKETNNNSYIFIHASLCNIKYVTCELIVMVIMILQRWFCNQIIRPNNNKYF